MSPDTLDKSLVDWVKLFFDYGPFFITLFFLIFGVRFAQRALGEAEAVLARASAERGPHAVDRVRYYRRIYAGVWLFSALLVVVSCVWWIARKEIDGTKDYVFRIDVSDVQPSDRLEPYSESLFHRTVDEFDATRRRDTFVAVNEKPLEADQQLVIVHKKGGDAPVGNKYSLKLTKEALSRKSMSFRLTFKDGLYSLEEDRPAAPSKVVLSDLLGIGSAFAGKEQKSVIRAESINYRNAPTMFTESSSGSMVRDARTATQALLDENSSLSKQIAAIDVLEKALASGEVIDFLQAKPGNGAGAKGETMLSYLLTLSRHEDRLLSYKARRLLEKADYLTIVTAIASSQTRLDAAVEKRVLLSLAPADWKAVEERLQRQNTKLPAQQASIVSKANPPLPSATVDGTKYYAKVSWSNLSAQQAECLADKLYRQNSDASSVAEEKKLIASRSVRGLAFDNKSESLVFANAVESCGAKTEFLYKSDARLRQIR